MRKIIGFMLIVAMAAIVLANCEAPGVATPKRTPPPVTAPAVASSGTAAQTGRVASPISPPSWIHGRWGVNDDGEVSDRDGWTFTADDVLHEGDWVNGSMRTHSENAGTTLTQEVIEEAWGWPAPTSSHWSILIRATYTITLAREGMPSLTYRWKKYGDHHLNYSLSTERTWGEIHNQRLTRR